MFFLYESMSILLTGFLFSPDKTAGIFSKVIATVSVGSAPATPTDFFIRTITAQAFELFFTLSQIDK